jgi:hypothetical protein
MAQDRYVSFGKKLHPSLQELRHVLDDYLGGAAVFNEDLSSDHTWYVDLAGQNSWPLRRINHGTASGQAAFDDPCNFKRRIEIYVGTWPKEIDVMTRHTDTFTNRVADGFAEFVAGYWGGKRR